MDHVPMMHTEEAHAKNGQKRNSEERVKSREAALHIANAMPSSMRGEQNRAAKHWKVIDPDLQIYEFDNLLDWARNNAELFGEEPNDEKGANRIAKGFICIGSWMRGAPSRKRPVTSYKGWGLLQLPTDKIEGGEMKEYKLKVIDALVAEAQGARIVELKKTAQAVGVDRLTAHEAEEVLRAAVKQLPDYKIVQIVTEEQNRNPATASLWETGALAEKTFSFEEDEQ